MHVGLTGGVASGKSTVSALLRELGAVVIDADALAREVVEPGTPGLEGGRGGVRPRGARARTARLDRARLGAYRLRRPPRRGCARGRSSTRWCGPGPTSSSHRRRPVRWWSTTSRCWSRPGQALDFDAIARGRRTRRRSRSRGRCGPRLVGGGGEVANRRAGLTRGAPGGRDVRRRQLRNARRCLPACGGGLRRAGKGPEQRVSRLSGGQSGSPRRRSFCSASRSS